MQQLKAHYRVSSYKYKPISIHRRAVVSFSTQLGEYGRLKTKETNFRALNYFIQFEGPENLKARDGEWILDPWAGHMHLR